ncbi:uncharacterized protein LOC110445293 [Mizuhopecten yessoensis]|uniref:DED domain-containing protein n=1 Tax=Mizuhopecten yessoensis TaxID=6573 RepID=A0A210R6S9_MIZYE|nr:uncharacterized protein LOC110445293 [Mizuhopecten yessoensis]XP_021345517.1 uncharacterized protein LOC110445293 [Mizuhopecten yessoensis]OWF56644.1 hypothetical protein KP79_PYT16246 [Mizuhopecten yessoensis]
MDEDPFRVFLCKEICQNLGSEDINGMVFCIKTEVNNQELEGIKNSGTKLMEVAMKANLFTESDTSRLETMLDAVGRKDLVEKVKEYRKNLTVLFPSVEAPCNLEEHVIGRKDTKTRTSKKLETAMKTEDVIILSGVLGSGKTQLAINYGNEFHDKHPTSAVWMVRSKDQASLQKSLTTLADKLGVLKGKDTCKESENPINKLGDILANALMGKTTHIIIFDDVNKDCQKIVENLIRKFVPLKKTQGFIKVIVTTMDDLLKMPRTNCISVSGFTEEEAVTFLRRNNTCTDSETDALKKLASRMSYLPLGLSCAKTYMINCHKSGKSFLELLKANTLEQLDDKLKQLDESQRGFFSNLNTFIRIMEKDLDKDATEMFQMTQFLENENIPIILFDLLSPSSERCNEGIAGEIQHDDVETCSSLSTDSLVQAVQKFSFGTVQGIDDKRLLNTHTAVSLTLQAFTDEKRKRRLLNRLLWTCALILDKDNRHQDDYNRMASVLPHARSVLMHAENIMEKDTETCLLMAFVNDLVAYTSNFEGLLGLEKYHSDIALQFCYKVMETTEKDIDEEVSDKHVLTTHETHREFAKAKATVIDEKLTGIRLPHEREIEKFIRHFILHKRRTKKDVKILTECVNNYKEVALTMQQYEALCEKKKAVQLTDLMDHFIKEMILSIFYTYGRHIFYRGKYSEVEQKRKFCHYLFLADEFGEIMRSKCQESLPLYCMLAKLSGTLELVFEDIPELELATVNNLQHTARTLEQLLNDKSCYYIFGIFKMHAPSDNIHRSVCLKQLLRTYLSLLTLCENTRSDKTEIVKKGKEIIKKLENVKFVSYDAKNGGVWSRVGQFQFAAGDTKAAENAYKLVCPPSLLEGEVKSRFVSKHELTAAYGLADCYDKEEKKEHAKCILQRLLKMLPDIQNQEKENVRKRICSLDSKS